MLHKIKWLAHLPAFPFVVVWVYLMGRRHHSPLTLVDNVHLCFEAWLQGYREKQ